MSKKTKYTFASLGLGQGSVLSGLFLYEESRSAEFQKAALGLFATSLAARKIAAPRLPIMVATDLDSAADLNPVFAAAGKRPPEPSDDEWITAVFWTHSTKDPVMEVH